MPKQRVPYPCSPRCKVSRVTPGEPRSRLPTGTTARSAEQEWGSPPPKSHGLQMALEGRLRRTRQQRLEKKLVTIYLQFRRGFLGCLFFFFYVKGRKNVVIPFDNFPQKISKKSSGPSSVGNASKIRCESLPKGGKSCECLKTAGLQ